jgi:hypothetical protein
MAKKVRVKIGKSVEETLNLASLIVAKHKELGETSPLKPLNWEEHIENIEKALDLHRQAKEYERLAEQAHEQRNNYAKPIDELVKRTRDLLKVLHHGEAKSLGEFGFEVDDTPRKKKMKE